MVWKAQSKNTEKNNLEEGRRFTTDKCEPVLRMEKDLTAPSAYPNQTHFTSFKAFLSNYIINLIQPSDQNPVQQVGLCRFYTDR